MAFRNNEFPSQAEIDARLKDLEILKNKINEHEVLPLKLEKKPYLPKRVLVKPSLSTININSKLLVSDKKNLYAGIILMTIAMAALIDYQNGSSNAKLSLLIAYLLFSNLKDYKISVDHKPNIQPESTGELQCEVNNNHPMNFSNSIREKYNILKRPPEKKNSLHTTQRLTETAQSFKQAAQQLKKFK